MVQAGEVILQGTVAALRQNEMVHKACLGEE